MNIETKKLISDSSKLLNILIEEKENNKKYEQRVSEIRLKNLLLDIKESKQRFEQNQKILDKNLDSLKLLINKPIISKFDIVIHTILIVSLTAFFIVAILR
jgi:hypothetical protein